MRILHIISNMRPDSGGPQEAVRMMLRSAPDDCVSEVVTLDEPATAFPGTEPFTIHALGDWKKLLPWLRANRGRFDGVVLHGMWESLSYSVLRGIAGHVPYVVYPHGMLDPYFKRASWLKHMKKWLYWIPVQYWVMRRAKYVVFTTAAERDLAEQSFWLHRWNSAVIGLGAASSPTDIENCRDTFVQRWPGLRDKRFLLFLGRIDPKKGCDLLLEVFSQMARYHPQLHLVLAGPDPKHWQRVIEPKFFDPYAEGRVWWTGMLTGNKKWGALASCEAFVLPSHQENFGIAVVEALACAKPVLLTKPINIADDLASDGCALVEDDTLDGVKRLLARWLALTEEERSVMSDKAVESVAKRYDMHKNTSDLFALFANSTEAEALQEAHTA